MVQVCPRCHRANPDPAVFCWFDGVVLRQGAAAAANVLPHEFVFPSGRRCRTFDELVQGCQYEWEDARDLLRKGDLGRYLAHVGRHDLARAAQEAQKAQTDPDIALHQFLGNLPATGVQGPRLDLHPRRLLIGPVSAGDQRQVLLTVSKQGTGLLQGRVTVSEGNQWLKIAGGTDDSTFAVKTARAQQVALKLDARGLAAPRAYSGKLTVVTNGGVAEVPVRLDVNAMPFPRPPFQGAGSPREMAERMRANPKPAVPLLESGEIARWFRANGWNYPVAGATAKGVAAVQQFFEGMGLSKPPPLQLSDQELRFLCVPSEVARGKITLRTTAKKWVYAQAEADVPWLKVTTPAVSGPQQAHIAFEIDTTALEANRVHQGTLQLVANAGQRLAVRVQVDVRKPREPVARRLLRPVVVGAVLALVLRLLLAAPADVYARGLARPVGEMGAVTGAAWAQVPEDAFLRSFVLATWWLGGLIGFGLVWRHGGRASDLFCGAVAGAFAGLVGSATLGCLLLVCDAPPRALLARLIDHQPAHSPWYWLPLGVGLAAGFWALVGGSLAFLLSALGRLGLSGGPRLLGALAAPAAGLFRACGLERAASFFALQG